MFFGGKLEPRLVFWGSAKSHPFMAVAKVSLGLNRFNIRMLVVPSTFYKIGATFEPSKFQAEMGSHSIDSTFTLALINHSECNVILFESPHIFSIGWWTEELLSD